MNTNTHSSNRHHEFRQVGNQMVTVGLPLPIELAALKAAHSIKPYTSPEVRARLTTIIRAGRNSLNSHR